MEPEIDEAYTLASNEIVRQIQNLPVEARPRFLYGLIKDLQGTLRQVLAA